MVSNSLSSVDRFSVVCGIRCAARCGLAIMLMLGALACDTQQVALVDSAPTIHGRTEWTIGVADGDPVLEFGRIRGIALWNRHVYVADFLNHEIRVFDSTGEYVESIGRQGDGPGELRYPCCIAFDQEGRLWIWNATDVTVRYDVFRPDSGWTFDFRLASPALTGLASRRIVFDDAGDVVHPTRARGEDGGNQRVRLTISQDGSEVRRVYPPTVSPDSLGMAEVEVTLLGTRRTLYLSTPSTASNPIAHSPIGGFADAITSRYVVRWFDSDGGLLRVLERPVEHGPPLTASEVAAWEAEVVSDRQALAQQGATIPDMPIPTHKHPLADLFFDLDGRLWVERSISELDSLRVADLYSASGELIGTVEWPAAVDLSFGAIAGRTGYGVRLDSLNVPSLARLTFDIPEEP